MVNKKAEKLGEYIKKLRKDKNITAKELGSYVGYSQSYISALENNNNNNVPSRKVLNRLATAFGHIGYNSIEIEAQLYKIAGYPPRHVNLNGEAINVHFNKYIGAYDNISQKPLEKPYLDLSYLLNNEFNLRFQYKNNGYDEYVDVSEKQKIFINNMITQVLLLDNIEQQIETQQSERLKEETKYNSLYNTLNSLETRLEWLQLDLRTLNRLKKDFSTEKFKYEYNNSLQVLNMELEDKEEELDFSKESLLRAIDFVTKEITRLTNEYDKLDKED
ncbi:helix-turn-helix transcriptional regulator [Macrococcus caseolyticus]|uniref:helix-turn-helix domain-containing protein n=1 Tax=Macrococcoides caseolyticum TaxID=69966 RepID=UPI0024BC23CA|nr:helix-turn-helix transcriptional regulator [Macrococcus caseolyticus]MDJ1153040.1 helix-turn-helix transcriptional regulator [Macrococcus caseolyticus]